MPDSVPGWSRRDRALLVGLQILALGAVLASAEFMSRPIVVGSGVFIGAAAVWLALVPWRPRIPLILSIGVALWMLTDVLLLFHSRPVSYDNAAMRLILSAALLAASARESATFVSRGPARTRSWKVHLILASVFVLLLTTQAVHHHLRDRRWSRALVEAAAGADRLVAGGMTRVKLSGHEIRGEANVARLLEGLTINTAWSNDLSPCLCHGDYQLSVLRGERVILQLEVHDRSLRWPGGPWRSDARLKADGWRLLDRTFRAPAAPVTTNIACTPGPPVPPGPRP